MPKFQYLYTYRYESLIENIKNITLDPNYIEEYEDPADYMRTGPLYAEVIA